MNTKELENCLHLIGYWLHADNSAINTLLSSNTNCRKRFFEPFRKELDMNLLSKDTHEAKTDMIKYYIFEFWELIGFFKTYHTILCAGKLTNYNPIKYKHTDEHGTERMLNRFENYVVNSFMVFNILFNEIQLCCIKYKVDFFTICDELNFTTEYVDSGITLAFEKRKETLNTTELLNVAESKTKKIILEAFANIDIKQGWQYAFVSETDYNIFTDLLTNFFEYKTYTLPETTIRLRRSCKTKLAKVLGEIHKELSNENTLSNDTKYFQLIRILSPFQKETQGDLYKALTR